MQGENLDIRLLCRALSLIFTYGKDWGQKDQWLTKDHMATEMNNSEFEPGSANYKAHAFNFLTKLSSLVTARLNTDCNTKTNSPLNYTGLHWTWTHLK